MSAQNTEFTKKLRAAIRAKIVELGLDVDEELPDYVMVMVANKKSSERMKTDLKLFLGNNTSSFVDWLFSFFEKVQSSASATTESSERPSKSSSSKKPEEERKKADRTEEPSVKSKSDEKKSKEDDKGSHGHHRHRRGSDDATETHSHRNSQKEPSRSSRDHHEAKLSRKHEASSKGSRQARDSRSPSVAKEKTKRKPITYDVDSGENEYVRKRHDRANEKDRRRDDDYSPEAVRRHRHTRHSSSREGRADRYEGTRNHHAERYSDSDDELSPPRHAVKSQVVTQSRAEPARPKLSSQVVVKQNPPPPKPAPEQVKGSSSLFKRAMTAVASASAGYGEGASAVKRQRASKEEAYDENVLQVGLGSRSSRRMVMDEDEDEELENQPQAATRFIVRVRGDQGRRVAPAEELDELDEGNYDDDSAKADAQDVSPTDVRERRKRRADDPARAFLKLSGINRIKATRDAADSTVNDAPAATADEEGHPTKKKARALKLKTEPYGSAVVSSTELTSTKRSPPDAKVSSSSPAAPITPVWNGQINLDDDELSSSDDEAEIDAAVATAKAVRQKTISQSELPPTFVLSRPTHYLSSGIGYQTISAAAIIAPTVSEGKAKERCRFWPECRHGEACFYHHPVKPCLNFPNCYYGDKCLFVHPPCRFGKSCMKPKCSYTHYTQVSTFSAAPAAPMVPTAPVKPIVPTAVVPEIPLAKAATASSLPTLPIPCRYGGRCQNAACVFQHPKPCHYGANCLNDACPFYHAPTAAAKHSNRTWVAPSAASSTST